MARRHSADDKPRRENSFRLPAADCRQLFLTAAVSASYNIFNARPSGRGSHSEDYHPTPRGLRRGPGSADCNQGDDGDVVADSRANGAGHNSADYLTTPPSGLSKNPHKKLRFLMRVFLFTER
jgi:hypothetical protein